MNPHLLEHLYIAMGRPRWFWPLVLFVIFFVIPMAVSAVENME